MSTLVHWGSHVLGIVIYVSEVTGEQAVQSIRYEGVLVVRAEERQKRNAAKGQAGIAP